MNIKWGNVYTNNKKTLLVSKLPEESGLNNLIRTSFEDPSRVIRGPRSDEELRVVPHSIVGSVSQYEEAISMMKRNSSNSLKYSAKLSSVQAITGIKKEEKVKKTNIETVDDNKLRSIFHDFNNLKYVGQEKFNDFLKGVPQECATQLKFQENKLKRFHSEERKFESMSKYLAKRSKKQEDDLLINKTDCLRMKREVNEILENRKPLEERYGVYNWMISLRRPKNFMGTRQTYINLGSQTNPIWQTIKETIPKNVELVRSPKPYGNQLNNLSRSNYISQISESNDLSLKNVSELQNISIIGEDLLKIEVENSKKMQGRKLLYKKDYLDSLTAGHQLPQGSNNDFIKTNANLINPQMYAINYEAAKNSRVKGGLPTISK